MRPRSEWLKSRLRADGNHKLDFDRCVKWKDCDADSTARVMTCLAEDVSQQLARTIGDQRLIGESRRARDVHGYLDNPADRIELTGDINYRRQPVEGCDLSAPDRLLDRYFGANLADGLECSIHQRQLACGIDEVFVPHRRNVRRHRWHHRRQAESKISQPSRRQGHAPAPGAGIWRLR